MSGAGPLVSLPDSPCPLRVQMLRASLEFAHQIVDVHDTGALLDRGEYQLVLDLYWASEPADADGFNNRGCARTARSEWDHAASDLLESAALATKASEATHGSDRRRWEEIAARARRNQRRVSLARDAAR